MDVIDKVKKLLALGQSDNPNEAALAIARAQELMDRHAISDAMLEIRGEKTEPQEEIRDWEQPLAEVAGTWRLRLAMVLAKANGTSIWKQSLGNRRSRIRIIGRATQVEKVRYLFAYCEREIERLTKRHAYGNGRTYGNNFRLGCVDAISRAIKAERAALREKMRAEVEETALVPLESAIARVDRDHDDARQFGRKNLGLRTVSSTGGRYDPGARAAGRAAGAGIYPGGGARGIGAGQRRIGR